MQMLKTPPLLLNALEIKIKPGNMKSNQVALRYYIIDDGKFSVSLNISNSHGDDFPSGIKGSLICALFYMLLISFFETLSSNEFESTSMEARAAKSFTFTFPLSPIGRILLNQVKTH